MQAYPDAFCFAVSHTTRSPRDGELNGREYFFTDDKWMREAIDRGEFVEHAEVHGHLYGTSAAALRQAMESGRFCILDLDTQGVQSLRRAQEGLGATPHFLFITPPSVEALGQRLRKRSTESEEQMALRLRTAKDEIAWGTLEGNFDYVVVNDDLDRAVDEVMRLLRLWYPGLPPLQEHHGLLSSISNATGNVAASDGETPPTMCST